MSWRFPKYPVKNTQVIDLEDMNENFYGYAEELGGRLNEHNWKDGAIPATTSLAKDAAFVWHSGGAAPIKDMGAPPLPQAVTSAAVNDQVVPAKPTWTKVSNCSLSFTSPDCVLWVHGTAQVNQGGCLLASPFRPAPPPLTSGQRWNNDYFVFTQMAIQLDDYVIPETIVGGTEPQNDRGTGPKMPMMPLGTSLVIPVAAGQHTLDLVVRTVGLAADKTAAERETPAGVVVSCRELICLEMRR